MEDWSHYSTKISKHQRQADDAANSRDFEEAAFHAKEIVYCAAQLVMALNKAKNDKASSPRN